MEKEHPKEEIAKSNLLHKKNLYKLLIFLRDIDPIGYSIKGLRRELDITLGETQLNEIEIRGLIRKRDLNLPENLKKTLSPKFLNTFPEYIITRGGLEFLNSIETQRLNKRIEKLTNLLVWFGVITIFLIVAQLVVQVLQYFKTPIV